jgi:hypothetical protein
LYRPAPELLPGNYFKDQVKQKQKICQQDDQEKIKEKRENISRDKTECLCNESCALLTQQITYGVDQKQKSVNQHIP